VATFLPTFATGLFVGHQVAGGSRVGPELLVRGGRAAAAGHLNEAAILGGMTDPNEPLEAARTPEPGGSPESDRPTEQRKPAASAAADHAGRSPDLVDQDAELPLLHPELPKGAAVVTAVVAQRPVPMLAGRRQFARTTPVVVDRGRTSFGLPSFGDRRQLGQIGLVVLMVAALGAILLARIGQPGTPGLAAGGSPSPNGSLAASPSPTPRPTPTPSTSPGPSASSPVKSPAASPTSKPQTYKVKSGDTLSSIAARFHTTAKIIEQLNDIKSPFVIHPGEILKLP
jgi:nucleoid-associated protein YgaU